MEYHAPRQSSPHPVVKPLIDRVRSEFLEMPGLRLTIPQAQRLFGLDSSSCATVFDALTGDKFLTRGGDGRFAR
jgi:hypothetical protein